MPPTILRLRRSSRTGCRPVHLEFSSHSIWRIGVTAAGLLTSIAYAQSSYATPYFFTTLAGGTKMTTAGVVTTLAGLAGSVGTTEGTGSAVRFSNPQGIALDTRGNLYVADTDNHSIRMSVFPPDFTAHPASQVVSPGANATFTANATSNVPVTYQWQKDGTAVAGATTATLNVNNVQRGNLGNYALVATNSVGSTTSNAAALTVSSADAGRLINLSILTTIPSVGDTFTMGYVVGGSGTNGNKPLVIRAAGPSLAALNVTGTLNDPKIELFAGPVKTLENDNWGGASGLATAMANVGAFPFTGPLSLDAAVATSIPSGDNSVRVSAAGSGTGTVIAEIYDATPAGSFGPATPRLVNVSVLKHLGSGLTIGFVIGGLEAKTVLIRAVGPTLGVAPFNVPGVVADPQLTLFSGQTSIGSNNNWGGTAALTAVFSQVGAFALPATSLDAALVATLQPGDYTVQVSGVGATTGVAIVEVYEVP